MNTIMNSPDQPSKNGDEVPDQNIREDLQNARSDQALLEVIVPRGVVWYRIVSDIAPSVSFSCWTDLDWCLQSPDQRKQDP